MTNPATITDVLSLTARLDAARIFYCLSNPTRGAIMVSVCVPGERWEIEFHEDGEIGVEIFVSRGGVRGAGLIEDLFQRFGNSSDAPNTKT